MFNYFKVVKEINLKKSLFISLFLISLYPFLISCASQGPRTYEASKNDDSLHWDQEKIDVSYQKAYRNLKYNLLKGNSGIPVLAPGLQYESELFTDIKEGHIDAYHQGGFGNKVSLVTSIRLKSIAENKTAVRVGLTGSIWGAPDKESYIRFYEIAKNESNASGG